MQKRIAYVLILMSGCVLGLTALQFYWNYKNYCTSVHNYKVEANNALNNAVNKEIAIRQQRLVVKVKEWLADTSFIRIECNARNRDSSTVFTIQDAHPHFLQDTARKYEIGITKFRQKLDKITPSAKTMFINHFVERTFKSDLASGSIFYYTQGLGDSISKAFEESKVDLKVLKFLYRKELAQKGISSSFILNGKYENNNHFLTHKINASFRKPFEKQLVWASLDNQHLYYVSAMKGLIVSSLLLIGITLFCFYYTLRTLFNQHKLVELKDQFISNMTHEIHTPISSIQITAEALKKFSLDQTTRENYVDIILLQSKKLSELTKEVLANAKLEALGFTINETLDLDEVILTVIADLKLMDSTYINFTPAMGLHFIKGNHIHLARAISNVLENAIKYNNTTPTIAIQIFQDQKQVRLVISDNGLGIADEFKEKIFEQFYRIPTGNRHDIKGYGLGLSYVRKVILQHNGNIVVSDHKPNGSTFSINFPR